MSEQPVNVDIARDDASKATVSLRTALHRGGPVSQETVDLVERICDVLLQERRQRQQLEAELQKIKGHLAFVRRLLQDTLSGKQQAQKLAFHDSLTALPNRRFIIRQLANRLNHTGAGGRPVAVMFLDLDGFKAVNDMFGHALGDEVLQIIALRLTNAMRAEDVIGRIGGDEFVCIVSGWDDPAQLTAIANKLFLAVSAPMQLHGAAFELRPSIGIAVAIDNPQSSEALISKADTAMYSAKRAKTGIAFDAASA